MSKKEYDYTWTTATGKKIHIDDMTESHAKNCLKLLFRRIDDYNASIKPKETTRERMIRELNDPDHNPFQGELASEEWDREMEFQSTGDCGCQGDCYCHERLEDDNFVSFYIDSKGRR